jgi:hypothetical protein
MDNIHWLCNIEMVNFSTLWKSRLDSDDQQFHQYQQNEQLTLIKKQNTAYTDESNGLVWDRHGYVAELNQSIGHTVVQH